MTQTPPVDPFAPPAPDDAAILVRVLSEELRRLQHELASVQALMDGTLTPARRRIASPAQQLAVLRMVRIPTILAMMERGDYRGRYDE